MQNEDSLISANLRVFCRSSTSASFNITSAGMTVSLIQRTMKEQIFEKNDEGVPNRHNLAFERITVTNLFVCSTTEPV